MSESDKLKRYCVTHRSSINRTSVIRQNTYLPPAANRDETFSQLFPVPLQPWEENFPPRSKILQDYKRLRFFLQNPFNREHFEKTFQRCFRHVLSLGLINFWFYYALGYSLEIESARWGLIRFLLFSKTRDVFDSFGIEWSSNLKQRGSFENWRLVLSAIEFQSFCSGLH